MKAFEYSEFRKTWEDVSSSIQKNDDTPFLEHWLSPRDEDDFNFIVNECKSFHHSIILPLEREAEFRFTSTQFIDVFKHYSYKKIMSRFVGYWPGYVIHAPYMSLAMVAIAYATCANRRTENGIHIIYPSIANVANEFIAILYNLKPNHLIDLHQEGLFLAYNKGSNEFEVFKESDF